MSEPINAVEAVDNTNESFLYKILNAVSGTSTP